MEITPRPPVSLRIGDDLSEIDASVLRDAVAVDTSELTKPARSNLFAKILGVVWDQVSDHADDALRGLAIVIKTATGKGGTVVRLLGGIAAGLLNLAADQLESELAS